MELNEKIRILNKELEENRKRIITMESANKREKDRCRKTKDRCRKC